ncbi:MULTISPECIES: transglycosylase SLT domain-containing protein [unclassified Chelatococcus]|jgi:soluble lytic murein transglycosylase-like protein|uniref:lytic transglycosylase domain-containing protein n=1 Tax=unclassified Chelatococcus TaxID=2638111 RepID=UPI001BCD686A|nr:MULTISPECIES: transglycosylase SLT domain-containing protein [unclassified Chelatococcus]CAH1666338.1 Transglycosylase-like protein with SLT domain [Hyphomicrobiales bacterium]MBS7737843.1 transglycosylase SLT domain-containing protein [Chelatococcus sp. HY11]MBX3546709.1 transglycosylase SLT domain-containing protein [Chelatococcus sp.]MCO5079297.1 transglycosylase SLT domain-containing protein [Chelatococcus sp.]CAH1680674.1 Transglycosylase-like protein with SLT domain [Hyphomicrobiales 
MKGAYRNVRMLLTASLLATVGCITAASAQSERRALEIPPDLQATAKATGKNGKGDYRRKAQRTRAGGSSVATSSGSVSPQAAAVPEVKALAPDPAQAVTPQPKVASTATGRRKAPRPLDLKSAALRKPVAASLVTGAPRSPVASATAAEGPADKADVTSSIAVRTPQPPPAPARAAAAPAKPLKVAIAEPGTAEIAATRSMTDAGPAAGGVHSLIARHASANGVPVDLAIAVVRVESRFNPRARNGVNVGLTQISTATARGMGYQGPIQGLYDADTNLRYGIRYLAQAYRLAGGDTCRTVLKYQAGHRATSMTGAARAYCAKVKPHVSRR